MHTSWHAPLCRRRMAHGAAVVSPLPCQYAPRPIQTSRPMSRSGRHRLPGRARFTRCCAGRRVPRPRLPARRPVAWSLRFGALFNGARPPLAAGQRTAAAAAAATCLLHARPRPPARAALARGRPNTQHGPVCRPLAGHHHSPAHNPLASPAHNCVPNALARRTDRAAAYPWVSGARTWPGAAHPCCTLLAAHPACPPCLQQVRASCQPRARCPLKPPSPRRHAGPALRPAVPSSPHPPRPLPTTLAASLFTGSPFNPSSACVPGQPPMYLNGHPKRNCTRLASRLLNPTLHRAGWLPAVIIPAASPPPRVGPLLVLRCCAFPDYWQPRSMTSTPRTVGAPPLPAL